MEPISLLTFLGLFLTLGIQLLKEFFSARARAREENRKFKIDQETFFKWIEGHIAETRAQGRRDSGEARDVEERMERERKGRGPS